MTRTLKLLLAITLLAGNVFAQGAPDAGKGPPANPPGDADVSVKQRSSIAPGEMMSQGREYLANGNQVLQQIQSRKDPATKQKDIIKLNCVTDKQVQAKVNMNIAEEAMTKLEAAVTRNDDGDRSHEFTRLTIVHQKLVVLGAEAEGCIGEDLYVTGADRVEVEEPKDLPKDPTQPPPMEPTVDRPPQASPYR